MCFTTSSVSWPPTSKHGNAASLPSQDEIGDSAVSSVPTSVSSKWSERFPPLPDTGVVPPRRMSGGERGVTVGEGPVEGSPSFPVVVNDTKTLAQRIRQSKEDSMTKENRTGSVGVVSDEQPSTAFSSSPNPSPASEGTQPVATTSAPADDPNLHHEPVGGQAVMKARLYGSLYRFAYYFIDVEVGNPPQRQSVILDSGSSLLGFPCDTCQHCGNHIDQLFRVKDSRSSRWISCHDTRCYGTCDRQQLCAYNQSYSEGSSIAGNYLSDYVALGDLDQQNQPVRFDYIGCHVQETNLFMTQKAAGIFGISFPKGFKQPTLLDAIFGASGLVNTSVFAMCVAEEGGLFTVGGYDRSVLTSKEEAIKWTPIISHSAYLIALNLLSIEGKIIAFEQEDFGETMLDSGTTFSYFPPKVYSQINNILLDRCRRDRRCRVEKERPYWLVKSRKEIEEALPTIKLRFGEGVEVDWMPKSYMYKQVRGYWGSAIDNNIKRSTVLGLSFFKQNLVVFHRKENRIGFADAECPEFIAEQRPPPPSGEPYPQQISTAGDPTGNSKILVQSPMSSSDRGNGFSETSEDATSYPVSFVTWTTASLVLGVLALLLFVLYQCFKSHRREYKKIHPHSLQGVPATQLTSTSAPQRLGTGSHPPLPVAPVLPLRVSPSPSLPRMAVTPIHRDPKPELEMTPKGRATAVVDISRSSNVAASGPVDDDLGLSDEESGSNFSFLDEEENEAGIEENGVALSGGWEGQKE